MSEVDPVVKNVVYMLNAELLTYQVESLLEVLSVPNGVEQLFSELKRTHTERVEHWNRLDRGSQED